MFWLSKWNLSAFFPSLPAVCEMVRILGWDRDTFSGLFCLSFLSSVFCQQAGSPRTWQRASFLIKALFLAWKCLRRPSFKTSCAICFFWHSQALQEIIQLVYCSVAHKTTKEMVELCWLQMAHKASVRLCVLWLCLSGVRRKYKTNGRGCRRSGKACLCLP